MNGKARILIVDDEPAVAKAVEMALDSSRYDVDLAETAEAALPRLRSTAYDLLMLDKNLPGMSGVELLKTLRAESNDVWCVLMTGYATAESAVETLNLGVHAYLEKPFSDIYKVSEQVDRFIEARRNHKALQSRIVEMKRLSKAFEEARLVRIVIAAANTQERQWMASQFHRATDRVTEVGSASAGLEILRRDGANVLIVDAALNGTDVLQFLAEARTACPNLMPVVVTDRPPLNVATQYIDLGVRAVIERPLTPESFWPKMRAVLSRVVNEVPLELVKPATPA